MKNFRNICNILITVYTISFIISCNDFQKNNAHQDTSDKSIAAGKILAATYCASCHQLPDPSMLNARSWEHGVLPQMGPRLGIFYYGDRRYPSFVNDFEIGKSFYPSQPVISMEDWQHIIDYYTATSPDSLLPAKKPVPIQMNDALFQAISPAIHYNIPTISFIQMEQNKQLIVSDAFIKKTFLFNDSLGIKDSINIKATVTDVLQDKDSLIICNVGVLNPNNGKFGSIEIINRKTGAINIPVKGLMRPVQVASADINRDGKEDYIVCEFGNLKGALSWYERITCRR